MLAGIVVTFAIGAAKSSVADPLFILPLVVAFFLIRLFNPALSVLAVLVGGGVFAWLTGQVGALPPPALSTLTLVAPEFTPAAVVGLALPLYLVTMASQNLSGLAVLRAAGYAPKPGPIIAVTGLFSLLSAPFAASTTNLAAISAAICTGPDVHPDPAERWKTGSVLCACLPGICGLRRLACRHLRGAPRRADRPHRRPGAAWRARQRARHRARTRGRAHAGRHRLRRHRFGPGRRSASARPFGG